MKFIERAGNYGNWKLTSEMQRGTLHYTWCTSGPLEKWFWKMMDQTVHLLSFYLFLVPDIALIGSSSYCSCWNTDQQNLRVAGSLATILASSQLSGGSSYRPLQLFSCNPCVEWIHTCLLVFRPLLLPW